jgi:hypothetical protein
MAAKINATIGFEVTGDNNQKYIYTIDTKNGNSILLINDSCKYNEPSNNRSNDSFVSQLLNQNVQYRFQMMIC